MKNLSSKQVKKILLLVLFLVVIIGVLIYGNYRKRSTHSRVNNDQLFVRFESSDIVGIENKLPVSDSLGKLIKEKINYTMKLLQLSKQLREKKLVISILSYI